MIVRNSKAIGVIIRQQREDLGLTQQKAADKAKVSRLWLSQVENGHPTAQFAELHRTLAALGLDLRIEPKRPLNAKLAAVLEGSTDKKS